MRERLVGVPVDFRKISVRHNRMTAGLCFLRATTRQTVVTHSVLPNPRPTLVTLFKDDHCEMHNVDCVAGAREHLADGSVDLIITDPPYGIDGDLLDKHYNRDESHVVGGYIEVPAEAYPEFSRNWIREAARVLRPGGSLYLVSGYSQLRHVLNALAETDLVEVNHLIWKYNFGVFTRRKYISSHYHILYYEKPGGRRAFDMGCRFGPDERDGAGGSLNYQDREDVWVINREYKPGQVKNKNELPSQLLQKMIQYSSREGDLVADFFMGGGSTCRQALALGRRFVGFEQSPNVFQQRAVQAAETEFRSGLDSLRKPAANPYPNQGKPWTAEDQQRLRSRYAVLQPEMTKAAAMRILQDEFGRGRFSILNAIKKYCAAPEA